MPDDGRTLYHDCLAEINQQYETYIRDITMHYLIVLAITGLVIQRRLTKEMAAKL